MYEYQIHHIHCGVTTIIFGYSYADACRRCSIDPKLWVIDLQEYID